MQPKTCWKITPYSKLPSNISFPMNQFRKLPLLTLCLFSLFTAVASAQDQPADDTGKGAIIIVAVEGDVKLQKVKTEEFLPKENVAAGKSFFDGHTVITGAASKAVLLLSNGSITTVIEKTNMTFAQFTQKKFEKSDDKMVDLPAEPSNSTTKLKLNYGTMAFDVKKLNPGSSFEIDSPVGSAGIRGTAGQQEVVIDDDGNATGNIIMTEGTIAFTDINGNTSNVNQGQELGAEVDSDGNAGETTTDDAAAEDLAAVEETNQESTEQSSDVSVDDAGTAQEEATQAAAEESSESTEESSEEESTEEESSEETTEESTEETSTTEESSTEEADTTATDSTNTSDDATDQNLQTDESVENIQEEGEVIIADSALIKRIKALTLPDKTKSDLQKYSEETQKLVVDLADAEIQEGDRDKVIFLVDLNPPFEDDVTDTAIEDAEQILIRYFNYSDEVQSEIYATGDTTLSQSLLEHEFTNENGEVDNSTVLDFLEQDSTIQDLLVQEPTGRIQEILGMEFTSTQLNELLGYTEDVRVSLVGTGDAAWVKTLVDREYNESTIMSLLEGDRTTANILVDQNLDNTEIQDFYNYPLDVRDSIIDNLDPTQLSTLLSHDLLDTEVTSVLSYSENTRDALIDEPTERLNGILDYGLTSEEADVLFNYSSELRQAFVDAEDKNLTKALLSLDQPEEDITAILSGILEKRALLDEIDPTDKDPDPSEEERVSEAIATLLEDTKANGNEHIVAILYEEGDGKIDDTLLAIGQLGNDLLTDVTIEEHLDATRFFDIQDAVDNLFYQEVALIFDTWVLPDYSGEDGIPGNADDPTLGQVFAARTLSIQPGTIDLDAHFPDGQTEFFFTAAEEIQLSGEINFIAPDKAGINDLDLSFGAGTSFNIAEDTSITFLDGSINMGSRETSEFVKVSMEAGGDIDVASLENLVFQNSSLKVRAGDSIHLEAFGELSINGMQFSQQLQNIYMEATTIDLRNIFFPDGSIVHLSSQYGGIDGIYPTFPTGDPANLFGNREIGRVNFIENVGYYETIINNRETFDLFKDNIIISPLGAPTVGQ